jgi:hypothetical protein
VLRFFSRMDTKTADVLTTGISTRNSIQALGVPVNHGRKRGERTQDVRGTSSSWATCCSTSPLTAIHPWPSWFSTVGMVFLLYRSPLNHPLKVILNRPKQREQALHQQNTMIFRFRLCTQSYTLVERCRSSIP